MNVVVEEEDVVAVDVVTASRTTYWVSDVCCTSVSNLNMTYSIANA